MTMKNIFDEMDDLHLEMERLFHSLLIRNTRFTFLLTVMEAFDRCI